MNDIYVGTSINQTFNEDGNESANLKLKHLNPPNPIIQRLPVKKKIKYRGNEDEKWFYQ